MVQRKVQDTQTKAVFLVDAVDAAEMVAQDDKRYRYAKKNAKVSHRSAEHVEDDIRGKKGKPVFAEEEEPEEPAEEPAAEAEEPAEEA